VEYQLTARGETLRPVIDAMYAWGMEQGEAMRRQNGQRRPMWEAVNTNVSPLKSRGGSNRSQHSNFVD